ncbi:hypothetical protein LPB03_15295 [Polaribacter vadi]|uniref:LTD domain-containing protein n=1 Tax=Polaribacter vadi TaxID=1774273 RepID=A0A1B8TQS2_9FLAO|nr:lamin tail domain-containing protein [Polaribacter vadi]AOW18734.1 hypothetical protein LPB03_15295 [Polaribacter vadi]OBY61904.1 hypothetical protein LPB3_14010 [Polaribacter vadi]
MKKKNSLKIALTLVFAFSISTLSAQIYNADFSNDGDGFADHTSDLSPPVDAPASVGPFGSFGNQWSLSYTTTPSSDTSANSFKVDGGALVSDDWGGQGIFQSQNIDVSAITSVDISALSVNSGANENKFKYFYILDGGARVETADIPSADGDNVNYSILNLDVSGVNTLVVGFEFSENGGSQGYTTSSFTVTLPTPGITLSTASNNTKEDTTTATFTAVLNLEPTTDVVLNITSGDTGEVTVSPATLTFTNANWNTPQTITATGVDDALADGNVDVTITVAVDDASSDNAYAPVADVTTIVTNEDDDLPNIIINEILADPTGIDANGDGTIDTGDDEFVELVNLDITSHDLTGYTISDAGSVRYTFGAITIPAGGSVVIFGDGTPTGISGFADTAGTLSLNNGGDTVTLANSGATTIATYTYGSEANSAESIGRNDDLTGTFVKHSTISSNPVTASPGRYNSSNLPFSTLTWTGATDNSWTTGSNWSTGTAPTASDDVQILKTSNQPTVSTAVTVNSATINSGATLISTGTLSGTVTYNRALTNGSQWYYMSSPVIDENYNNTWVTNNAIPSSTQDVDNRGISWYDNSSSDTDSDGASTADSATGFWRYMEEGTSSPFAVGRGYGIIRSGAGNISFTGTGIYNSDQTFLLTQGVNNFNLIGNPFTAFITLGTFYTTNSANIDTDFYFWNGSSYTTKTSSADSAYEIAPGQGFFVEATSAANVTFEIADASHQSSDTFQKSTNTRPEIILTASQGNNERFARILYIDNTTKGYDAGYDGKLFGGVSYSFSLYSDLVESDGKKYQLQSLPNSNHENMVIPIGLIVDANKEISFSAEALNLPADINVYLEDRLTNTFTRLDEVNSTYKVTSDVALDGIGRFYLHTKNSSALSVDSLNMDNISIYKTTNSNLRIVGISQGKASIKLYSILGKQVLENSFTSNGVQDITLPALSPGIYIVQLETETGSLNKKITLE